MIGTPAFGGAVGNEFKAFNPTAAGTQLWTVESSQLLKEGRFNLGVFVSYGTNALPVIEATGNYPEGSTSDTNDSVYFSDTSLAYGLTDHFELGISAVQILGADAGTDDYRGEITEPGLAEVRPSLKIGLFSGKNAGLALSLSASNNALENNPYRGSQDGPSYQAQLIWDLRFSGGLIALNAGHKSPSKGEPVLAETAGEVPIQPYSEQWLWGAGAQIEMGSPRHAVILEAFGTSPVKQEKDLSDRNSETSEGLVGYRYRPGNDWDLLVGVGSELTHGVGTQDFRAAFGVNWKFPTIEKPKKKKVKKKKRKKRRLPPPIPAPPVRIAALPEKAPLPPTPLPTPPKFEVLVIHDVLFPFDSDRLILNGQNRKLIKLAEYLGRPPGIKKLVIVGHTCNMGSDSYNMGLSSRRATSIKNWLVRNYKIAPNKVVTQGMGERKPTTSNATEAGRKKNRRVEFRIYR